MGDLLQTVGMFRYICLIRTADKFEEVRVKTKTKKLHSFDEMNMDSTDDFQPKSEVVSGMTMAHKILGGLRTLRFTP
eukprot:308222-Prymnesium_polylepis.1